jgi:predicted DNA-binding transcriptional regulator YafY
MARSPNSERVRRLNTAVELVREHRSTAQAAKILAERYGLSKRQAYRYLREAQAHRRPLPVPEAKMVFTVKLPKGLVHELREFASLSGRTLSEVVSQALETFLRRSKRRGRS